MNRFIVAALAAGLALSGCGDGNPFEEEEEETTEETDGDVDGITGDRTLPPGTASPQPNTSIVRSEPTVDEGGNQGDGYATDVRYDAATDTFYVDNLAFGGELQKKGIDFDWEVVTIEQPADRMPKEVFYLPALALLALITWLQLGRARKLEATGEAA